MKLAISNIAWTKDDDNKMYDILNDLEINHLEIAPTRLFDKPYFQSKNDLIHVINQLEQVNIQPISMQSILFGQKEPIFCSDKNVKYYLNQFENICMFAQTMKIPNLVFGSPSIRNVNTNDELSNAKFFFKELGKMCKRFNVNIALEANPKIYNTNFLNTSSEVFAFVKEINEEMIGVNLDLGTIIENEENIVDILNSELIKFIKHVHISEPYLALIDKNHKELHIDLLKILKSLNYSNFVSIEMKSGPNIDEIKSTLTYIRDIAFQVGVFNV